MEPYRRFAVRLATSSSSSSLVVHSSLSWRGGCCPFTSTTTRMTMPLCGDHYGRRCCYCSCNHNNVLSLPATTTTTTTSRRNVLLLQGKKDYYRLISTRTRRRNLQPQLCGRLLHSKIVTAAAQSGSSSISFAACFYSTTRLWSTATTTRGETTTTTNTKQPIRNLNKKIDATQKWLETVVVGEKLCPFAPPFLKDPTLLRIVSFEGEPIIIHSEDKGSASAVARVKHQMIDFIRRQVDELLVGEEPQHLHETTLIVLDVPFLIQDFREFVRFSWEVQEQVLHEDEHYDGKLQIVLFHPKATHQTYVETSAEDDDENASDYTIRSPYPTIHLLREIDVLKAVQGNYPNLDTLPQRNQYKFQQQGALVCRQRLQNCFDYDTK